MLCKERTHRPPHTGMTPAPPHAARHRCVGLVWAGQGWVGWEFGAGKAAEGRGLLRVRPPGVGRRGRRIKRRRKASGLWEASATACGRVVGVGVWGYTAYTRAEE